MGGGASRTEEARSYDGEDVMRELVLGILLTVAAAAVVVGVALISTPAAWIVGGVLGAVLSWVAVGELGGTTPPSTPERPL
jgi:hypothetical protein